MNRLRPSKLAARRKRAEVLDDADKKVDKLLIRRLENLFAARRFVLFWVLLLLLLIGAVGAQTLALKNNYQSAQFVLGGTYAEGVLGDFTTANPLFAEGSADSAVASLVFAGLLKYNNHNKLVGDLASGYNVNSSGKVYTVNLKPHLTWQDGRALTADDVAFTYHAIQNPDSGSPLYASWQNVTVSAVNKLTVKFSLSNPLASFPYSLTNGIVPKHILGHLPAAKLRSANFNVAPIGAGPFQWQNLAASGDTPTTRQQQITLAPFNHYNGGAPKLSGFVVRSFHAQKALLSAFQSGALNGLAGLQTLPSQLKNDKSAQLYSLPLNVANMVFFNNSSGVLADKNVRRALVQGADVNQIINGLNHPVIPVREPLLQGQLGFNSKYRQLNYNPSAAAASLQKAGWRIGAGGLRYKKGQALKFRLSTANNPTFRYVTAQLARQWRQIGVDAEISLDNSTDLKQTIVSHNYDALLYGIAIGVDPDVYVYWDSTQTDPRSPSQLNFSEYKSKAADKSLEAGRTRLEPQLRAVKYQPFLKAWQADAPALGLYQPRFLYVTSQTIDGLKNHTINQATDRFDNVQNWQIDTIKTAN
ncbi:MAG: peptide ABC transporter substrate-binding protein [Candidatus Saccharimonadales bacterium]